MYQLLAEGTILSYYSVFRRSIAQNFEEYSPTQKDRDTTKMT